MGKNVATSEGRNFARSSRAPHHRSNEKAFARGATCAPEGRLGVTFGGGFIGSIMSSADIAKASDDAVINAFKTLPDSTMWSHPSDWEKGGNIQLAREVCQFR